MGNLRCKIKYEGKKFKNNNNEFFTIIKYFDKTHVNIKFDDGTIVNDLQISNILHGRVKNINYVITSNSLIPVLCNVGYTGIGKYTFQNNQNFYFVWKRMIERCYNINLQENICPSYIGCTVNEYFHNFQNFCKWCDENNYHEDWQLDKDILIKGNKIYGPDTCCFVPQEINGLFAKANSIRGNLPIGVYADKKSKNYNSKLDNKHLGCFDTINKTFIAYKNAKELKIKNIADKWKLQISNNVFEALNNYIVEITD